MSEKIVTACDIYFEFKTKNYNCENIVHHVDLGLRKRELIRGMNDTTIKKIQRTTLHVIKHMKKFIDEGFEDTKAFELSLDEAVKELF